MINKGDFEEKMESERHIAEENDAKRRSQIANLPYLDLISTKTPTEIKAMMLVHEADARAGYLVPLKLSQKKLLIAVLDPALPRTQEILNTLKEKYELEIFITSERGLTHAWSYYHYINEDVKDITGSVSLNDANLQTLKDTIKTLPELTKALTNFQSPYISQSLELILAGALALHASDIHLEPKTSSSIFRLRIDGILHDIYDQFSHHDYELLATRIKLLSNLKINIRDEAQDGRFTINLQTHTIEIRTSIIPSEYGETIVLRLLDPTQISVHLEELGWRADDLDIVSQTLKKPNGLILNTGPTGSGKTTTLYAFLKHLQKPEIKIITIEDPIEYHLDGISQTQIDADAHYTFASGLRSILRQDPNIVLVGEIRDQETADIAMNAALTGHIVFTTLHTNDAVGAIPRLIDLKVDPHIIGPSVSLVIAQRLVRVLCPQCKKSVPYTEGEKKKIELFISRLPKRVAIHNSQFIIQSHNEPQGCEQCNGLGYKGRTSIFELFAIDTDIESMIYQNPSEIDLFNLARKKGMVTMQEDGILKVLQGVTSFEEVRRLTGPIEWLDP